MRRNRAQIVGDQMQKVLSDIIQNRVGDPRIPFMTTVTGAKMSSDLTHCTVFISIFGDDKTKQEAMRAIEHAKGFIRCEMVKQINLRVAPELHFKLDNTLDEAARIDDAISRALARDEEIRREAEEKRSDRKNNEDQE
ncbi:MAG: 30S ribosome-binding factor RbfA [Clostridiales bacterium]|nr:30S ribosome-binding factor RbfA [Clostridiales bacterium]